MWQVKWIRVFVVIIVINSTHGIFIAGPKYVQSNKPYTLVLTNTNPNLTMANLLIRLEGYTEDNTTIFNLTKSVDLGKDACKMETFNLPKLMPGDYKIAIEGQKGFKFHKENQLVFLGKPVSGLIQINKPVFKPGDVVFFRIVVLDSDLKAPADITTVNVTIQNPQGDVIRNWPEGLLQVGVYEGQLKLDLNPLLGMWKIIANSTDKQLVSKSFEVKKYVLNSFDVEIVPTTIPLMEYQGLNLTISAKNVFGYPVSGTIDLYLTGGIYQEVNTTHTVLGTAHVQIILSEPFDMDMDSETVTVNFTFKEQYTNRTLSKSQEIIIYRSLYRAKLITKYPYYRQSVPYRATIKVEYHDGIAAANISCRLQVGDDFNDIVQTDLNGEIKMRLHPHELTQISITLSIGDHYILDATLEKTEDTTPFVEIELLSDVQLDMPVTILGSCDQKAEFVLYYVLAKNNIIYAGLIRPREKTFSIQLSYTDKMVPKAKVLVATFVGVRVTYEYLEINFYSFLNNFSVEMVKRGIRPGGQVQLILSGRPASYVALSAYDKRIHEYGSSHDLTWQDVDMLYSNFHKIDENEFDPFLTIGMFIRVPGEISSETPTKSDAVQTSRDGRYDLSTKTVPYRTLFAESFLWKNYALPKVGQTWMVEDVFAPHTMAPWILTGFSMDPVFGFGIIQKPIEFSTEKSLYIVESLPYSIKRDELAELQFTIFNNLAAAFTQVQLSGINNQMEVIVDSSIKQDQIKVLHIPSGQAAPVSFLVRARKLGEVIVRVQASNLLDNDAIEKVIRVVPESLVEKIEKRILFSHDTFANESFQINLHVDDMPDPESVQVQFELEENPLIVAISNMDILNLSIDNSTNNIFHLATTISVADLLLTIDSDVILTKERKFLLQQGYSKLLRNRQIDGSFHDSNGNVQETLCALYLLMTFQKHSIEVDDEMVNDAYKWLESKQHVSGRFDVGKIHTNVQDSIVLTSSILIAFLENPSTKTIHSDVIRKAIEYVTSHLYYNLDSYELSIASYALYLNDSKSSAAVNSITRLLSKAAFGNQNNELFWSTRSQSTETIAYFLMAIIEAKHLYSDDALIMRSLAYSLSNTRSTALTKETYIGLKALKKFAEQIPPPKYNYTIQISYDDKKQHIFVNAKNSLSHRILEIPNYARKIDVNVTGVGLAFMIVRYNHSVDIQKLKNQFNLVVEQLNTSSKVELKLKICVNYIPRHNYDRSHLATVEVNFPSGFVVDQSPISEQTPPKGIKSISILFGATTVMVRYVNLGIEENCFIITAYRRELIAIKRPAYVIVRDSANPERIAVKQYTVDDLSNEDLYY